MALQMPVMHQNMQQNNLQILHGTATCAVYYVNSQGKPNAQDKDLLVSTFKRTFVTFICAEENQCVPVVKNDCKHEYLLLFILYGYSYAHGNTFFFYKNGVLFIHVLSLQPGLVLTGMCCRLWILFLRLYYPLLVNEPSHKKFSVPHDIDVYAIMNTSMLKMTQSKNDNKTKQSHICHACKCSHIAYNQ